MDDREQPGPKTGFIPSESVKVSHDLQKHLTDEIIWIGHALGSGIASDLGRVCLIYVPPSPFCAGSGRLEERLPGIERHIRSFGSAV
jgi:putative lipase involved disintegration of autophagic bodies